jgi:hypothetical protein
MSQFPVLKILLKLATLNEAVPGKLVDSVCSCDLNLITRLRSFAPSVISLTSQQLISEDVAKVSNQSVEVIEL